MCPGTLKWYLPVVILLTSVYLVSGSEGDLSPFYQSCAGRCFASNCTLAGTFKKASNPYKSYINELMQWNCADECQYTCMWTTVVAFQGRGWKVPQFYGKWPFIRILGLQEPASVIFSALNFITQFIALRKFCKELGPDYPFFWVWILQAMISLNSWIWSVIFHARDTPFTEMMDYMAAFSVVIFFLFCCGTRVFGSWVQGSSLIASLFCAFLYIHHTTYLLYVKFDYGYNMMVNITVGLLTSLVWLIWSWRNYYRLPYVCHLVHFLVLGTATAALEILDFPPFLWSFDAHALWHMSTIPLPFLLYKFATEDCKYMKVKDQKKIE